ncbi:MAG: DUF1189 domain-containing protein [Acidobacteriota bacterium]
MGIFSRLVKSIINPAAYGELVKLGLGKAMGYLILLVLLVTIPVHIYQVYGSNGMVSAVSQLIDQNIPDFSLSNGVLQVDAEMPITIAETPQNLIVIDTSGRSNQSILNDHPEGVLFTKDQMVVKQNGQVQQISLSDLQVEFNKDDLFKVLPLIKTFGIVYIILGPFVIWLIKMLQVFTLMGLVALIVSAISSAELSYTESVTVAVYAMTLPFLVQGLQKVLIPTFPYPCLLYYILFIICIILGVQGAKNRNTGLADPMQTIQPTPPPQM